MKFDFARSEALKGMRVTNIKPLKVSSSFLWAKVRSLTGLIIQLLPIRTYMKSLTYKRPLRDGGTSGPRLVWMLCCRLCHLYEDGGDLRCWALVGYTPRGLQVVQCSGWRQRCGLDRVDDCSHGRQQSVDPGERRADSFHPDHVHVAREPRHEAHEPGNLFTRSCSIHQRVHLESSNGKLATEPPAPGHPGEFFVDQ